MSRPLAYAANTQEQVIGAGGVINFGNAIRRYSVSYSRSRQRLSAEHTGCRDSGKGVAYELLQ